MHQHYSRYRGRVHVSYSKSRIRLQAGTVFGEVIYQSTIRFSYVDALREILSPVGDDGLDLTPLLGVFRGVLVFQLLQI